MTRKKTSPKGAAKKGRRKVMRKTHVQTSTYSLADVSPPDPKKPFNLPIRDAGWFPDAVDMNGVTAQRIFPEEVVGRKGPTGLLFRPFGIPFNDINADDEFSKEWALGRRLKQENDVAIGHKAFTRFVRRIALRVRQYNASLYRLRRLHVYWDYQNTPPADIELPDPNPDDHEQSPPNPQNPGQFKQRVFLAENGWQKDTVNLNSFLETGTDHGVDYGFYLVAADMVAVNGYIISMRIVAQNKIGPFEPGGSSSHVSISSLFSSSLGP